MSAVYKALRAYIFDLKKQRVIAHHDRLPSERQLLDDFGASRITIREALFRLESEGVIYRRNRKGWFLSGSRFVIDPSHKSDFNATAETQGKIPSTQLLLIRKVKTNADIRGHLQLAKNSSVFEITRKRCLDERPILIETIYLNAATFSTIQQFPLDSSITQLQRHEYHVLIEYESCRIRVETLGEINAATLEVNAAMPALRIERTRMDKAKMPVDYNIEYWLHGAVELAASTL